MSQNSQENTCVRVSFLIKMQVCDSGTGVFLWILWKFKEHLFYRTPLGDCFCWCEFETLKAATRGLLWKKVFLEIPQNSQENTCARVSRRPATKLKKRNWRHRYFPVDFAKFLRTPFLQNTSGLLPREVFFKKAVLKYFAIFTGKHLYWSLCSVKFQASRSAILLKKTPTQMFFRKYYEFLRASILKNIRKRLLIYVMCSLSFLVFFLIK